VNAFEPGVNYAIDSFVAVILERVLPCFKLGALASKVVKVIINFLPLGDKFGALSLIL
jgi:hypothetical protein